MDPSIHTHTRTMIDQTEDYRVIPVSNMKTVIRMGFTKSQASTLPPATLHLRQESHLRNL